MINKEINKILAMDSKERYIQFQTYCDKMQERNFQDLLYISDKWGYDRDHLAIGKRLNINAVLVKRHLDNNDSRRLYLNDYAIIAYDFLRISCHRYFFEEEAVSILPRKLSGIAAMLIGLSKESLANFVQEVNELCYSKPINEIFVKKEPWRIAYERMYEMANDKGIKLSQLCSERSYPDKNFTQILRKIQRFFQYDDVVVDNSSLEIRSFAFAAIELNQSLDYFVSQDYLKFNEIGYYAYRKGAHDHPIYPDQELIIVDNKDVREIIRKYLYMNKEYQDYLFKKVLKTAINNMFFPEELKIYALDI